MTQLFMAGAASVRLENGISFEYLDKKLFVSGPIKKYVEEIEAPDIYDTVIKKISEIISRVQYILKVYPIKDSFGITFLENKRAVSREIYKIYGMTVDKAAMYSTIKNMIFVSVANLTTEVLAGEITCAFMKMHFKQPLSFTVQKVLSQYVVDNLNNKNIQ